MDRRNFIKSSALTALFLNTLPAFSKSILNRFYDDYDELICRKKFKLFADENIKTLPIGEAIGEIGKSFIDTDYIAGSLDGNNSESLVINLTGFDCVTFVENCLTFARCVLAGKTTFDDYKKELQKIRYRNGSIDGYSSRLHYFCDWIYNNEENKIIKDISSELGGVIYDKKINFMSSNPQYYKQLSNQDELDKIIQIENDINSRKLYYIPAKNISTIYDNLQTGDIIATTTNISGLDVTHTGFIYKEGTKTKFMHASSKSKKVVISNNQLHEYVAEDKKKTGIIVARPL
jgi:hypothetical protein